jgi:hypothetical protein
MTKAEQYRRDAAAAVKLAGTLAEPADKALMLMIALDWLDLALQDEAGLIPCSRAQEPRPRREVPSGATFR